MIFDGSSLTLNMSTSAAGGIQVEMQNGDGKPVEGYALKDCEPVFGDTLQYMVKWKSGVDVSSLAGKPIRLRFTLKDADLYSFRFVK